MTETLPHFPALAQCMLVESRLSSRQEIKKDIQASALFEVTVEAGSVPKGLGMLETQDVDACFIGPSVSIEKAVELLKMKESNIHYKDCAFICIVDAGSDRKEPLLEAGAHGVLERPYSKLRFTEGVVAAVISANKNSPWRSLFEEAFPESILLKKAPPPVEPSPEKRAYAEVFLNVSERLRIIMEGSERGEFLLNNAGYPAPKTQKALSELVNEVFVAVGKRDVIPGDFRAFVEQMLINWFIDYIQEGEGVAKRNLKGALLSYGDEEE